METNTSEPISPAGPRLLTRGKVQKASHAVDLDDLLTRVCKDLDVLFAASEEESGDGEASRARVLFLALAMYLDERGIIDELRVMADWAKASEGGPGIDVSQLVGRTTFGTAMSMFFDGATARDFRLKNKLYQRLSDASFSANIEGLDLRHVGMAAVDLARVIVTAQADQLFGNRTETSKRRRSIRPNKRKVGERR